MTTDITRAAELACVLARVAPLAAPYRIACVVHTLQVVTRRHKRGAERRCNEPLTEAEEARLSACESRLAENARKALAALWPDGQRPAAYLHLGGDPRGACGYLRIDGSPGDGWGGDGWPIY